MASLCHITKEKISSKNFTKTTAWKVVLGPFVFAKNDAWLLLANEIFEARYLYHSKSIKICPNQHAGLHRIFFTEDSLEIKKGLELVSRTPFSYNFLVKFFFLQYCIHRPNLITRLPLHHKLFNNMCFVFHAWAFGDVLIFEYVKC